MKVQHMKIFWMQWKAVFRGKVITKNAYIKKEGKSQINNPILYLKNLEKEQQTKPTASRMKEIKRSLNE